MNISIHAQEKSRKELKGDKYRFSYSYDKAIHCYTHAKHLTFDGQRNLAVSYQKLNKNINAEETYAAMITSGATLVPEDYINYAMVLKTNGKFEESSKWMEKFQETKPNDLRAKSYVKNRMDFNSLLQDESKFKILSMDFNTSADDFWASYYQDKIVFASTRNNWDAMDRKYNWNNRPYLDLYVSKIDNKQLETPVRFDKRLNGKIHDGPASFNNDGTLMAYTRNNYKDKTKDKIVELQIYFSTYSEGDWTDPVPFIYNNPNYSVGQPHLTADGKTMYFISDMPGGFGGADIYKTTKTDNNEWSKPENLGNKINTEGEEMFPFLQEKNNLFCFASDGHYGFGGLDIFMCSVDGNKYGHVSNVGFPLNTQHDDYALILNDSLTNGYFSSNRNATGFDNIFSVEVMKKLENGKKIAGIAKDKNGKSIPTVFVTLQEENSSTTDTLTTNEDGSYTFFAETNKLYMLIGVKNSYLDGHNNASTFGTEPIVYADLIFSKKFTVDSSLLVEGTDLVKIIKAHPSFEGDLKMDIAYFDFDKFNIRPDAARELDKIVSIMNDYPTMVVQLSSFTDCSASEAYNQILSDKRAQASLDYIKKRITKPERITGHGYGETKLLNGCDCEGTFRSTCPDNQNQLNRRTEFIIMKKLPVTKKAK